LALGATRSTTTAGRRRPEADAAAAKRAPLDADTLFPVLVWAMVHAELPSVHACLSFLRR